MGDFRCPCVGRIADNEKVLLFYFNRRPSDDEMRYLHEVMQRATACSPIESPKLRLVEREVSRDGHEAFEEDMK